MPAFDFSLNKAGFAAIQAAGAPASVLADKGGDSGFSLHTAFHDVLDIVNPLQHLPVVGTLYRAITHDKIGTLEKIAGDTLYGGLWGAVGSVADTAFEAATGKDFGATMLAMVFGDDDAKPAAMAAGTPAPAVASAAAPQSTAAQAAAAPGADMVALSNSLNAKGVNGDLSARALFAYRQSQILGAVPQRNSLVAPN
jgi:hypothetical protein